METGTHIRTQQRIDMKWIYKVQNQMKGEKKEKSAINYQVSIDCM